MSKNEEPTQEQIQQLIKKSKGKHSFYSAREELREMAYGGEKGAKPPNGYSSWGDYWKSY
jgi:hypothetical protein